MTRHHKYKPGQKLLVLPTCEEYSIQHIFKPLTRVIVIINSPLFRNVPTYKVYSKKHDISQIVSECCLVEDTPENRMVALLGGV